MFCNVLFSVKTYYGTVDKDTNKISHSPIKWLLTYSNCICEVTQFEYFETPLILFYTMSCSILHVISHPCIRKRSFFNVLKCFQMKSIDLNSFFSSAKMKCCHGEILSTYLTLLSQSDKNIEKVT